MQLISHSVPRCTCAAPLGTNRCCFSATCSSANKHKHRELQFSVKRCRRLRLEEHGGQRLQDMPGRGRAEEFVPSSLLQRAFLASAASLLSDCRSSSQLKKTPGNLDGSRVVRLCDGAQAHEAQTAERVDSVPGLLQAAGWV